jgi:hypothetical protein
MKRYQECRWPVRLWRRRHYLAVPVEALLLWLKARAHYLNHPCSERPPRMRTFSVAWGVAKGSAQFRMEWWYSMDELRSMFGGDR